MRHFDQKIFLEKIRSFPVTIPKETKTKAFSLLNLYLQRHVQFEEKDIAYHCLSAMAIAMEQGKVFHNSLEMIIQKLSCDLKVKDLLDNADIISRHFECYDTSSKIKKLILYNRLFDKYIAFFTENGISFDEEISAAYYIRQFKNCCWKYFVLVLARHKSQQTIDMIVILCKTIKLFVKFQDSRTHLHQLENRCKSKGVQQNSQIQLALQEIFTNYNHNSQFSKQVQAQVTQNTKLLKQDLGFLLKLDNICMLSQRLNKLLEQNKQLVNLLCFMKGQDSYAPVKQKTLQFQQVRTIKKIDFNEMQNQFKTRPRHKLTSKERVKGFFDNNFLPTHTPLSINFLLQSFFNKQVLSFGALNPIVQWGKSNQRDMLHEICTKIVELESRSSNLLSMQEVKKTAKFTINFMSRYMEPAQIESKTVKFNSLFYLCLQLAKASKNQVTMALPFYIKNLKISFSSLFQVLQQILSDKDMQEEMQQHFFNLEYKLINKHLWSCQELFTSEIKKIITELVALRISQLCSTLKCLDKAPLVEMNIRKLITQTKLLKFNSLDLIIVTILSALTDKDKLFQNLNDLRKSQFKNIFQANGFNNQNNQPQGLSQFMNLVDLLTQKSSFQIIQSTPLPKRYFRFIHIKQSSPIKKSIFK